MKKHSKTGVESRFQGTALGIPSDVRPVKIEGGGPDSIDEWNRRTREKAVKAAELKAEGEAELNAESMAEEKAVSAVSTAESTAVSTAESTTVSRQQSEDVVMETD